MTTSPIIKFHKLVIKKKKRKAQQQKLLAERYKMSAAGAGKDESWNYRHHPKATVEYMGPSSCRLPRYSQDIPTIFPRYSHGEALRDVRRRQLVLIAPNQALTLGKIASFP